MKIVNSLVSVALLFSLTSQVFAKASDYARATSDRNGAVASVNPIATAAGLAAFEAGGNAIDAAVATALTLGVVDSHNSGIGGGCFIVVHTADGTTLAIDGREMAPAAAFRDMFIRDGKAVGELSRTGALAVGVPGSVAAMDYIQRTAGKLNFADVIFPAAKIAENGFPIDSVLAKRLARNAKKLSSFPSSARIFLKDNKPLKAGDTLVQADLAKTYLELAKKGPDYFYAGEFAQSVEDWMIKNKGLVRAKDFKNYQLELRTPIVTSFKNFQIIGFPPPSSGGVLVAEILNMLENFELKNLSEAQRYHVIIEAMKLAFADRAQWLGDPDHVNVPKGLIDKSYAKKLAEKIDLKKVSVVDGHNVPPKAETELFGKHTTHIATADKAGNWVAMTTTLNTSFGSKVVIPGTGVLMNNQMDDFSAQPGVPNAYGLVGAEANSVQPLKRPLSSMTPTIALHKGKPVLTVGAAGGPTIITQVLQVLINKLALEEDLVSSMGIARVHHQWRPDRVYIDGFAADELKTSLTGMGHTLKVWPPFGATQAIAMEDGEFVAVTEPRLVSGNR